VAIACGSEPGSGALGAAVVDLALTWRARVVVLAGFGVPSGSEAETTSSAAFLRCLVAVFFGAAGSAAL